MKDANKKKRNFFLDKILRKVLKRKRDIYVPRRFSNHIRRRYSTRLGDVSREGRGQIQHRPHAATRKQCLMKITLAEYRITLHLPPRFFTRVLITRLVRHANTHRMTPRLFAFGIKLIYVSILYANCLCIHNEIHRIFQTIRKIFWIIIDKTYF